MKRAPILTLAVAACALMVAIAPPLGGWLIYDRSAILSGQFWRLFTGNWVHLSPSHLVLDVAAFAITGSMIEIQRLPGYGRLCVVGPWFIGGALLVCEPQMGVYGGLSGLATACLVYTAICGLSKPLLWRWICLITLAAVVGKIALEVSTDRVLFAAFENCPVVPSTASHIAGAITALLLYGMVILKRIFRSNRAGKSNRPAHDGHAFESADGEGDVETNHRAIQRFSNTSASRNLIGSFESIPPLDRLASPRRAGRGSRPLQSPWRTAVFELNWWVTWTSTQHPKWADQCQDFASGRQPFRLDHVSGEMENEFCDRLCAEHHFRRVKHGSSVLFTPIPLSSQH